MIQDAARGKEDNDLDKDDKVRRYRLRGCDFFWRNQIAVMTVFCSWFPAISVLCCL
jgi:hypothetical protein